MPVTSGTYNKVTLTVEQVVRAAMQDIRVLPVGRNPSPNDLTDCALRLNAMCKVWATKGLLLWLYDLVAIPLVQNKFRYTIGANGDVDPGYRPLRAMEGSYIRTACSPTPYDTALTLLSRVEYLQIANKSVTGIPNSFYYDVQLGPGPNPVSYDPYAEGWGVLYVWVAPSDETRVAYINVERPIQDQTAGGHAFDAPAEWYDPIIKNLAARIADMYEIPEDRIRRLKMEADAALTEIADWGMQEWAPVRFQPSFAQGGYRNGFRGR